jgi:hypothetical protein
VRVRRDEVDAEILGPINDELLVPSRVARMAKEMEADHAKQMLADSGAARGCAAGASVIPGIFACHATAAHEGVGHA